MVASFSQLARWLTTVSSGRWVWGLNSRCKYVTIIIDTRSGAYKILDRDGKSITFEELEYQYDRYR